MTDLLLIDADALKESWARSDHKGRLIDFINNAPLIPAVPLADHERMKREMHSEITALKKQLAEVTAERDKAVEDLRKAAQCDTCKHNGDIFCSAETCKDGDQWQWRGTVSRTLSPAAKNNILNDFMKGVE